MTSSELKNPIELLPIFRERVWGRRDLPSYFSQCPVNEPIGEVWYSFSENSTSLGKTLQDLLRSDPEILGEAVRADQPDVCPLLVKLIFTTERLSVQVHPDDEYARAHHNSLGKTEAWFVMDAQPPGEVAIGLKETVTPERFEAAVRTGEIESMLDWRKVQPGEIIFTPAGTVHAIGAGLTVCEIQENSDITYRLYDYGRPRELHLEHGLKVSKLGPHEDTSSPTAIDGDRTALLACEYFQIERLQPHGVLHIDGQPFYMLLICIGGYGTIDGQQFGPGRAFLIPAHANRFAIDGLGSEWILTYTAKDNIPKSAFTSEHKVSLR